MSDIKNLGRVWASNPIQPNRDVGEEKYSLGFIAEIPTYQVLNYLHNRIDTNLLALAERGVFQWDATVAYRSGALAWDANGFIYKANRAVTGGTTPSINTAVWERSAIQLTKKDFDGLVNDLNTHKTDYSNPHRLTAAQLDAYTRAQVDALIAGLDSNISAHANRKDNPHAVTAAQIGAVPITGGTYTGTVTHSSNTVGLGSSTTNAFVASSNKVYLKKGGLEIGLNAAGLPYFSNGAEELLLTEDLFLQHKEASEVSFAVPEPDTLCNFIDDIHMYRGVGPTEFTSTGGKTYTNKAKVNVTAKVDEPRLTVNGMAFIDNTESLKLTRTYDGFGFTDFTQNMVFHVDSVANTGTVHLWEDNGFLESRLVLVGKVLTLTYKNSTGSTVSKTLHSNLSTGRHSVTMVVSNTVTAYLDGVQIFSEGVSMPARTGWNTTSLMKLVSGTLAAHNYIQNFRVWAYALTDRQASKI